MGVANPGLGPLADNGGPTLTVALLPGSPAIDAGENRVLGWYWSLTTDQCGFPRLSGSHVDIGACEFQQQTTAARDRLIRSFPDGPLLGLKHNSNG